MKESITAISEPIVLLCLAAFFVILFVTILKALKEMSFFEGKTVVVVALCVSLLCILGLRQTFFGTRTVHRSPEQVPVELPASVPESEGKTGLEILLSPYTALAIATLFMLLLLATKRFRFRTIEKRSKPSERQFTEAKLGKTPDEERRISR